MKNARDGGIDAATVRRLYGDFNSRLGAYIRVLGRLRELTVLQLTDSEWREQQQFVDRLVEQLVAKYDRERLRELCEWVQEHRQQAGMPSPRINGKLQPTALQFALWWFQFVGEAWKRTKQLGLSGNDALGYFHDCLNDRPPPAGDQLHALLSDEHTLARRALKAMAVPKAQPAAVADAVAKSDRPSLKVNTVAHVVILDSEEITVTKNQAKAFDVLLKAGGEFVSLSAHGIRSREIDDLPEALKQLIDAQPGAGTRLLRDKIELA